MRRYRSIRLAVLLAALVVACGSGAVWLGTNGGSSGESSTAAPLPTACDNFVGAARRFAEHGSAGVETSYSVGFLAAATNGAYETLKTLLHACDDQLVEMTSR